MSLSQVSGCLSCVSCERGISFEVLLPHLAAVIVEKAELAGGRLCLRARARADHAACTRCGHSYGRVHSTYGRRLADAAIGGRQVRILLAVRRFFCGNPECPAVTFAEQVEGLTSRRSRRTPPLKEALTAVALALAGRAGARLAALLNLTAGRSSMLRLVMTLPDPDTGTVTVLGAQLSGVRTDFRCVFAGSDAADASAAWSGGGDAVLLEQAAEPEKLTVGGGELFLELADRCPPRIAFAAEFLGEDVHDVAVVRVLRGGIRGGAGLLLVPEFLDAVADVVVAVEEVEADPGSAGDGPEVDFPLVLDERADRGLGAGNGGLPLGLRGLPQCGGAALCSGAGHGVSGLGAMVMFAGPASW